VFRIDQDRILLVKFDHYTRFWTWFRH